MSNPDAPVPTTALTPDSALWQLLKAYANEDWDWRAAPWPAPAEAFLADGGGAAARRLVSELDALSGYDDAAWRACMDAIFADWRAFAPDGALTIWAAGLRQSAAAAARP